MKHTTNSYNGVHVLTIPAGVWGGTEAVSHTATGEANGCKRRHCNNIIIIRDWAEVGFLPL